MEEKGIFEGGWSLPTKGGDRMETIHIICITLLFFIILEIIKTIKK